MKTSRTKLRKIRKVINKILVTIKFKIEAFSLPKIIILVWITIWYISLFMPHISPTYTNIFNKITKISSIIIILILTLNLFLLFSYNKKEKIKKASSIVFRDYIIIIISSIILFILSINNLWFIIWLQTFDSNVSYWNWIIMLILSSIILFIWAILLKQETFLWNNIYMNDSHDIKKEDFSKNNTKLPF